LTREKWGENPTTEKLTIFDNSWNVVDMSAKLPPDERVKNAGISLEPDLVRRGKDRAKKKGLLSLSAYVRQLLIEDMNSEMETAVLAEGNTAPLPHNGAGPANIHSPSAGGSKTPPTRYQTAREAARSSK
jgi:hypothetical protein